jgi:hypothetical protein
VAIDGETAVEVEAASEQDGGEGDEHFAIAAE